MTDDQTTERSPSIWAALARAQARMRTPARDRSVTVATKTGGKYSYAYATLAEVLRATVPALSAEGVALVWGLEDDPQAVTLRLVAEDGSSTPAVRVPTLFRGGGPQDLGSALTYARRYALTLATGVAADDDDDGSAATGAQVERIEQRHQRPPQQHPREHRAITTAHPPDDDEPPHPASVEPPRPMAIDRERLTEAAARIGLSLDEALAVARGWGCAAPEDIRRWWATLAQRAKPEQKVPSVSKPGTLHTLRRSPGGSWSCTCEAARFGRACHHAAVAETAYLLGVMPDTAAATVRRAADEGQDPGAIVRDWLSAMGEP